ncbi:polyhydroxyalkanoate synthesis repressor PhaR [Nordella sp. HKS 07]|uniref:polyhydroxyalkanoate synthesis repressor PhaR n=1 Tax=Nordella sp. HKS 07 TaxID=2712222 RepID=UPI0013E18F93|nr:polyhydroxyalkanoate synthesis repressor PhaR [Nordella sp. HKS 07]QIG48180.1 polyhydroxyalkanoate synthesis repressor PhaR [Nordella sp. HKS 07]
MSGEQTATANAVVIKKYANRRLYNTATSTYVTLDDLAEMVKKGTDFVVYDAKTGEEITRSVLTQIIFEEEGKGQNLLPIRFLRQLIRFYGDSMQAFVPGYLEMSLESLTKEQDKLRQQMAEIWGADPFKAMQEQTERNMVMFHDAMRMFNPFTAAMAGQQGPPKPAETAKPREAQGGKDDLQALKDQLSAMQRKIDAIAGGK